MKVKTLGTFTKIVGYARPIGSWNQGKQQEMKDRRNVSFTS